MKTGLNVLADNRISDSIVTSCLAIERCQSYVAHIHALLHIAEANGLSAASANEHKIRELLGQIDAELSYTTTELQKFTAL